MDCREHEPAVSDDRQLDGIDVSRYQNGPGSNRPDWQAVLGDPRIRFIACKASENLTYVDPEFRANRDELRRLVPNPSGQPGAPWLAWYHFRGNGGTLEQAEHFRATVGPVRPGEGVVLDCEGATAGTYGDQRALCAITSQMFDRVAIRYGNDTPWDFAPYVKWCARYRSTVPNWRCALWQWGGADVPGIVGAVDANRILDESDLARAFTPATQAGDGDMTAEESKMLRELHALLIQGAPGYGVVPTPPEVSRIGRLLNKVADKLGVSQ